MSIEVHVRVRPGVATPVWSSAETVLYSTANPNTRYVYNKVHPNNSGNQTIFQGIEAIVHAAFDGKNVTVMAYGQTGSGKTYSMTGMESDPGVVPRTAKLLLELKKIHPGTVIQAYYTEIYNESVKDLLEPQRGELALHDAPDGGVTFEKRMVQVEAYEDFLRLQAAAERNRKYGVTNLNDHSSRSHIILTFEIHRPHRTQKSVINLVDLAGSESAARANTEGMSLREGGFINKSLLTLGNVVDAIVEKRPYVPYRDAKLTRILRTCLGGTGITFILCCINPSRENYEQTITTLRFTQRAMKIKNDPVVVLNMPPLFTHQFGDGAAELMSGMQESAEAEYQCGLRDAFMFGSNTAGSVVANFQSQVSDSLHALANAQRLLIAHDHAMAMDRVGRLYNQLNELTRQKAKSLELVETERKRMRDLDADVQHRRAKLVRLEAELAEKEAAADTDLAGWEYQLHEARQRQVREVDLLLRTEETRRARVRFEWAVCMERIASRYVPALSNLMAAASALSAATEESDSNAAAPAAANAMAVERDSSSKAVALVELRERLTKARAELADLELAHEMVREDVEQARRGATHDGDTSSSSAVKGKVTSSRRVGETDVDAEESFVLARQYRAVSDTELNEQLADLEHEEQRLKAQAKREIRRESLRQVRESLRRPSRSPQSGGGGAAGGKGGSYSRSATPQAARLGGNGKIKHTRAYCDVEGEEDEGVIEEEEQARQGGHYDPHGRGYGRAEHREDEAEEAYRRYNARTTTANNSGGCSVSRSRRAAVVAAAANRLASPTISSANRARLTERGRSSSLTGRDTHEPYSCDVRNALSVLDSVKNRLRQLQHNPSSSSSQQQQQQEPEGRSDSRRKAHPTDGGGSNGNEPTLFDLFAGQTGHVQEEEEDKENYYGYHSRPGQGKQQQQQQYLGKHSSSRSGHHSHSIHSNLVNNNYGTGGSRDQGRVEMVVEDDEAFASADPSPGDVTPPIVGIAARRRWVRQNSQSPRPDVERALYALQGNNSPSHSAERHSRSRRAY